MPYDWENRRTHFVFITRTLEIRFKNINVFHSVDFGPFINSIMLKMILGKRYNIIRDNITENLYLILC